MVRRMRELVTEQPHHHMGVESLCLALRIPRRTAARWGFWHMGHFGHDYKALFGETPSHTRLEA